MAPLIRFSEMSLKNPNESKAWQKDASGPYSE
jgi:hypothetical protein